MAGTAKREVRSEVAAWEVLICICEHCLSSKQYMALPVVALKAGGDGS